MLEPFTASTKFYWFVADALAARGIPERRAMRKKDLARLHAKLRRAWPAAKPDYEARVRKAKQERKLGVKVMPPPQPKRRGLP
jgi:hypothetical protein